MKATIRIDDKPVDAVKIYSYPTRGKCHHCGHRHYDMAIMVETPLDIRGKPHKIEIGAADYQFTATALIETDPSAHILEVLIV